MGCSSCSNGNPKGCGNKGHCSSGSCNKRNTYDWFSIMEIPDEHRGRLFEVSFKDGAQKGFYIAEEFMDVAYGEPVVVEAQSGFDIGRVSLSGELVKLQMKKKRIKQDAKLQKVIRAAHERDLERLEEARSLEKNTLVRARAMIKTLDLNMKLSDVQYQGDKRKATFYYTAEGRIDFRELVRVLAGEFRVKIEMRQIGARQESALIGGIGSCGRELCCSTWLSEYKSVTTAAARYQNIAINQAKLSGQCGRLKCCLNYELDSYMEALKEFPKKADYLKLRDGKATLVKMDIFKRVLYYSVSSERGRAVIQPVGVSRVKKILELNKNGSFPERLVEETEVIEEKEIEFADVTGELELPSPKKDRGRNGKKRGHGSKRSTKSRKTSENSIQAQRKNTKKKNKYTKGATKSPPKSS